MPSFLWRKDGSYCITFGELLPRVWPQPLTGCACRRNVCSECKYAYWGQTWMLVSPVLGKTQQPFSSFHCCVIKWGALRYPSVSKTVVCTVDIVFIAAASLLCYQRGVKLSAADYITLSKQSPRSFFFFIFSLVSVVLCVHRHNLSLHVSVAFIQINSNHRATLAESDDRLGD